MYQDHWIVMTAHESDLGTRKPDLGTKYDPAKAYQNHHPKALSLPWYNHQLMDEHTNLVIP